MKERRGSDVSAGELIAPIECGPPSPNAALCIMLSDYCMPPQEGQRKSFPEKISLFIKGNFAALSSRSSRISAS